jgi:hypothetical protein
MTLGQYRLPEGLEKLRSKNKYLNMWYFDTSYFRGRGLLRLTFFTSSLPVEIASHGRKRLLTFERAQAFHHFAKAARQMFVPAQNHAEAAREPRVQR